MKKRGLSFKAVERRPGFSRELTGKKSGPTSYRGAGFDEPFPSRRLHANSDFTKR